MDVINGKKLYQWLFISSVAAFSESKQPQDFVMNSSVGPETIDCPYCAETIKKSAKKCLHCGEIIDAQMRDIEALKKEKSSPNVFMNAGGGGGSSSASGPSLRPFKHWLHIIISIFTGGLWLPFYVLLFLMRNKSVYY